MMPALLTAMCKPASWPTTVSTILHESIHALFAPVVHDQATCDLFPAALNDKHFLASSSILFVKVRRGIFGVLVDSEHNKCRVVVITCIHAWSVVYFAQSSFLLTSVCTAILLTPFLRSSSVTIWALLKLISTTATAAPASPRACAKALPTPCPAPAIRTKLQCE